MFHGWESLHVPNIHYLGLTDHIERVQRYFTHRVYYRCNKLDCSHDYWQRLKFLNLESLELRRIYNDLIMVCKIVHGLVNINANELIHIKTSTSTISTRGHRFKLQTSQFKLDAAKNQFCNRVVCNWYTLPDSIVATDCSLQDSTSHCKFRSGTDFQPTLLIAIVSA